MLVAKNRRTVQREEFDRATICDVCKREIAQEHYRRADVDISAAIGDCYPEGDLSTTYELDCCAQCFLEKVKPLLERELGLVFRERRSEEPSVYQDE